MSTEKTDLTNTQKQDYKKCDEIMNKVIKSGLDEIRFRNYKEFKKMLEFREKELKSFGNIYIKDKKIILR